MTDNVLLPIYNFYLEKTKILLTESNYRDYLTPEDLEDALELHYFFKQCPEDYLREELFDKINELYKLYLLSALVEPIYLDEALEMDFVKQLRENYDKTAKVGKRIPAYLP